MKGGKRPGAGRKRGGKNTKTAELARKLAEEGLTPLEYMLEILRREPPEGIEPAMALQYQAMRFEAAKAAAPYVHPKLANVELSGTLSVKKGAADYSDDELLAIVNERHSAKA